MADQDEPGQDYVDVTLCDDYGVELDLGTPINATREDSSNACCIYATNISPVARHNRNILSTALTEAGLINTYST